MKKYFWFTSVVLILLIIGLITLSGCTGDNRSDESVTDTASDAELPSEAEGLSTDPERDGTDANETEKPAETDDTADTVPDTDVGSETATVDGDNEGATEAWTLSDDPSIRIRITEDVKNGTNIIREPNMCDFEYVPDPEEDGIYILKLTTKGADCNDPHITLNYTNYVKCLNIQKANADDYPYVAVKVRNESIKNGQFELFYCAGRGNAGPSGEAVQLQYFDTEETGWQWIVYDLTKAKWSGAISQFRFDFSAFAGDGEVMYISEVDLFKSDTELYRFLALDMGVKQVYTESAGDKAKVDELLSAADSAANSAYYSYKGEKAQHEDSGLSLTFKEMIDRTAQNDNASLGNVSGLIRMAKNEIESIQVLLAASEERSGLKIYVTDFQNKDGVTLKTELLWGYYFEVEGRMICDPLPPVKYAEDLKDGDLDWNNCGNHAGALIPNYQKYNGFDIKAGENQTFVLRVHTGTGSPAGEYAAVVTVTDKDGNQVKKATVYAWVWDFALSDATACKTLMDVGWYEIYADHRCYNGDDGLLYQRYYDYLLDNRICGYDVPYNNKDGDFSDDRVLAYLDNPRVTAFQAVGWKGGLTGNGILRAECVSQAYDFLSAKREWLDKAYFYPIDEPILSMDPSALRKVVQNGIVLKENFPGYKLIVPMCTGGAVSGGDYFSYVADAVTAWCPHLTIFTTYAEYRENRHLTYMMTVALENKLGTFPERMAAEQAGGDEVWWYVTHCPNDPELTVLLNTDAMNCRILFWQQKLFNIDGFLYYSVNHWYDPEGWQLTTKTPFNPTAADFPGYDGPITGEGAPAIARPTGLNSKHETNSIIPFNSYGNGVLVYMGQNFGEYGPVGSYRLECVRDGIEDFEYLTMLQNIYGKDTVDLIIRRITTSIADYTDDHALFSSVRDALGCLLEQSLKNAN